MIFPHCRECTQQLNALRYDANAEAIRQRRLAVWHYLAPQCALCGFEQHVSAMDLHHLANKEAVVSELITAVTLAPDVSKAEKLLREASKCVALCSNCHRMVHANFLKLPNDLVPRHYVLADLLHIIKS
jgi:hypothetical protein